MVPHRNRSYLSVISANTNVPSFICCAPRTVKGPHLVLSLAMEVDDDAGDKFIGESDRDALGQVISQSFECEAEDRDQPKRTSPMQTAAARRVIRGIRWILGPSEPLPTLDLPQPAASCSLSITLGNRSTSLAFDKPIHRLGRSRLFRRALIPFLLLWATANVLLIRQQYYVSTPQIISCDSSLWDDWPPDTCGLDATGCMDDLANSTFRCMGGCRDVVLGNPRWVGDEIVNKVPLIIGGGDENRIYR